MQEEHLVVTINIQERSLASTRAGEPGSEPAAQELHSKEGKPSAAWYLLLWAPTAQPELGKGVPFSTTTPGSDGEKPARRVSTGEIACNC